MDVHLKKLAKVCKLRSNYILKQKTPILATAYSDTILKVFWARYLLLIIQQWILHIYLESARTNYVTSHEQVNISCLKKKILLLNL